MLLALAEVGSAAANIPGRSGFFLEDAAGWGSGRVGEAPENSPGLHRRPVPLGQGQGRRGEGWKRVSAALHAPFLNPLPLVPSLQPLNLQMFGVFIHWRHGKDRRVTGGEEVAVAGGGERDAPDPRGER